MKRLISLLLIPFMILLVGIKTFAFDWRQMGAELVSQTDEDSKITVTLKDNQGHTFNVVYQDDAMLAKLTKEIVKLERDFYSWRNIHLQDLSFMVFANCLEVVINPREITYHQINIAPAVPAGITMTYEPEKSNLNYDCRIMKDDLFVRVTGAYRDETELLAKLGTAYDDPLAYLQQNGAELVSNLDSNGENERTRQAMIYWLNEDWNGRHKALPPRNHSQSC